MASSMSSVGQVQDPGIERRRRLVDQLMSMHAALRDRYGLLAAAVSISHITIAFVLSLFLFADDGVFCSFGLTRAGARFVMGFVAAVAFLLSIVDLTLDWRRRAAQYASGVRSLGILKLALRSAHDEGRLNQPRTRADLRRRYETTMSILPEIPEGKFASLKAKHQFKRTISKALSEHPKAPVLLVRLRLRWEGTRGLWQRRKKPRQQGDDDA